MFRPTVASILTFSIIATSGPLHAAGLRCDDVFSTNTDVLRRQAVDENFGRLRTILNERLPRIGKWLNEFDASKRQRRIEKLVDSFDVESANDRARLERHVTELVVEIYGTRTNLYAWMKSKDQRLEKRAIDLVREKVLREGLRAITNLASANEKPGIAKRAKEVNAKVMNRMGQWFGFPLVLPKMGNVEMPKELFAKILRDGYEPHAAEFQKLVGKKQSAIDAYNTFKGSYTVVVFVAFLLYFQYDLEVTTKDGPAVEVVFADGVTEDKTDVLAEVGADAGSDVKTDVQTDVQANDEPDVRTEVIDF